MPGWREQDARCPVYFATGGGLQPGPPRMYNPSIPIVMEQLNRIEVIGRIGNASLNKYGEAQCARFSVATDYVYKDREGTPTVETTWHNAVLWEGRNTPDLTQLVRGRCVHLVGRIRQYKYTSTDGSERTLSEIYVTEEEQVTAQCNF